MKNRKIKIVISEPGKMPEVKEIEHTLEAMQSIVGGYVECIALPHNIDVWLNEEGLLMNLPFNRYVGGVPVVGTIFAASRNNAGDTLSLSDKQITSVMQMFG